MHISKRPLLVLMASILSMLAITACQGNDDIEEFVDFDVHADHTLLMYMVGDNNLSPSIENNVRQAQNAILDSVSGGKINLLVFKDTNKNGDSRPKLYWVHGSMKHMLDTVMLREWNAEVNASDPDFMAEVIKTAFSQFDTPIKGMTFASHASGWVPLVNHTLPHASRRAFGYDEETGTNVKGTCELWQMSEALAQCPHFDYLIMDCCHMGNAEVAYEMRDITRYMLAGACETQGAGIPYRNAVTRLSKCKSTNDLPEALDYIAHCYYNENAPYNGGARLGATMSVYDLANIESLATAYQQLISSNADRLKSVRKAAPDELAQWLEQFQPYGREYTAVGGSIHYKFYFYDMRDVIEWLSDENAAAGLQALTALSSIVKSEYHDTQFWALPINRSCGMAVSLPEAFLLAPEAKYRNYFMPFQYAILHDAYHYCSWGARMGY